MESINQAVYDFMDKRLGIYVNPFNVEIILDEEDAISVSCGWPGEPVHAPFFIELEFDSPTIEEFVTVFGITSIAHIGTITPALLMELYYQGKVVIFSAIDKPPVFYSLHFRKRQNKLSVKGSNNIEEEVKDTLETTREFMTYTLQHFHLAGKS
jgi:hypothetical protein